MWQFLSVMYSVHDAVSVGEPLNPGTKTSMMTSTKLLVTLCQKNALSLIGREPPVVVGDASHANPKAHCGSSPSKNVDKSSTRLVSSFRKEPAVASPTLLPAIHRLTDCLLPLEACGRNYPSLKPLDSSDQPGFTL